jgi:Ca2+:H+ antiporter
MPGRANGSNEQTPLLAGGTTPNDESRWKSMPKHVAHVTWETLTSNYVNVLLVFVPIGIIAGALKLNPTAVFILNFIAIIPLAALLSYLQSSARRVAAFAMRHLEMPSNSLWVRQSRVRA